MTIITSNSATQSYGITLQQGDEGTDLDPAMQSFLRIPTKAGAMTENGAEAWANDMRNRSDQGVFFGAGNYYGYAAKRC